MKKPEASKPKKTPTEPPPSVRMPKPSTESTVYNYSMGIKPDSGTKAAGRGRGVSVARGSGLPNGHSAPPGFGRGRGVKRQLQGIMQHVQWPHVHCTCSISIYTGKPALLDHCKQSHLYTSMFIIYLHNDTLSAVANVGP